MLLVKLLMSYAAVLVLLFGYTEWRYYRAVSRAKKEKGRG